MNVKTLLVTGLALATLVFCLPNSARADDVPKGEVGAYGGGVWIGGGGGTHAVVGGAVGGDVTDRVHVFGEFNYVPLGSASFGVNTGGVQVSASASEKMLDFGGGVHIHLLPKGNKVMPYVVGVVGDGHQSLSASGSGTSGSSSASVSMSVSDNSFYFGGGAGVRCFINDHFGVRPEFRYQRYTSQGGGNMMMFTVGVFYRFGGK